MPIFPWIKKNESVKRAEEILDECGRALGLGEKTLGKSGKDWVANRKWGDDPQELKRIVYYAALSAAGKNVEAVHFPPRFRSDHEAYSKAQFENLSLEEVVRHKVAHFFERLGAVEVKNVHRTVIAQVEKPLLEQCLKWSKGNQLKTARVLGIDRNTLRKKMKELKIDKKAKSSY